jgi:hypothetical protein
MAAEPAKATKETEQTLTIDKLEPWLLTEFLDFCMERILHERNTGKLCKANHAG